MTAPRTLVVEIEEIAIGDGEIPPPEIGAVLSFPLRFAELPASAGDTVTIHAELEPSHNHPVFQYTGSETPRRWEWHGLLRGDGWTASWRNFRPLTGQVELTGRFYGVMGYDTEGRVRGRVTRVQLVSERYRRRNRSGGWEPVPGYRRLREVDRAPRFFDVSMMTQDDDDEVDRDVGALVDLDLDDVPPLPLRPTLVPGDISAAGSRLWVADDELPVVVDIDSDHVVGQHVLPGPIGTARRIWAASDQRCWVGGGDGLYLCAPGAQPQRISEDPVHAGAVYESTFLACGGGPTWSLHAPDREPIRFEPATGSVASIAVHDGAFFAAMYLGNAVHNVVRIDVDGTVGAGPGFSNPGHNRAFIAGSPLRIVCGDEVLTVNAGLTATPERRLPRKSFRGGQVGNFVWIIGHPPDGTGLSGWWPLDGPVDYDRTPFWLFTLLDETSLDPVSSTPVRTSDPRVAIDDRGTVWVTADGVRAIPRESMQWPDLFDVAAMIAPGPR
ncbi:hypothetical protein OG921_14795 [Aldersonia sp. NBC_00410]|uniref:DUF6578 domain-containing protein n=1 Tax=Aldersonia sp. NBC_00410 TaxID=2975954 RepID=UPI00225738F9|nr:DUF6578 domain-containing protein [Aldersonia sp. NBC_00410]MCX5044436.1 hypothetical protein [Aldersonia sp. NBC_00410]